MDRHAREVIRKKKDETQWEEAPTIPEIVMSPLNVLLEELGLRRKAQAFGQYLYRKGHYVEAHRIAALFGE